MDCFQCDSTKQWNGMSLDKKNDVIQLTETLNTML